MRKILEFLRQIKKTTVWVITGKGDGDGGSE